MNGRYSELLKLSTKYHGLALAVGCQMDAQLWWQIAREQPDRFNEASEKAAREYSLARQIMGVHD